MTERNPAHIDPNPAYKDQQKIQAAVQLLMQACHIPAREGGWWHDLHTGKPHEDSDEKFGLRLALVHSELSEALEGRRKKLQDDHLPHFPMAAVELADALIRICDMADGHGYDLANAVAAKLAYNAKRADHKLENRRAEGGKAF